MGIERLYMELMNRKEYPDVIRGANAGTERIDLLYIDVPNIIGTVHNIAKRDVDARISEIFSYLDRLVHWACPTRMIFYAFEGNVFSKAWGKVVSKYSRVKDQMQSDEQKEPVELPDEDKEDKPVEFREFIITLTNAFDSFLAEHMQHDPPYRNKQIIVSPYSSPGEAEHKIMDDLRIRASKRNWKSSTSVCICSMDNDLIMYALSSHIRNMKVLNKVVLKNDMSGDWGWFCDITRLREWIGCKLGGLKDAQLATTVDDIVALQVMSMPDDYTRHHCFLPHLRFGDLVAILADMYEEDPEMHFMLGTINDGLNGDFTAAFFRRLLTRSDSDQVSMFLDAYPGAPVEDMAVEMLKTYAWVFYLYKSGVPSITWFYRYLAAPPISCLIEAAASINVKRSDFDSRVQFIPGSVIDVIKNGGDVAPGDVAISPVITSALDALLESGDVECTFNVTGNMSVKVENGELVSTELEAKQNSVMAFKWRPLKAKKPALFSPAKVTGKTITLPLAAATDDICL